MKIREHYEKHVGQRLDDGARLMKEFTEFIVSLIQWLVEKKRRLWAFIFIEGWIHSLAYQHLADLHKIIDAFPPLKWIMDILSQSPKG